MSYETVIEQVKSVPECYLESISEFISNIKKNELKSSHKSISSIFGILPNTASLEEAKEERTRKSI